MAEDVIDIEGEEVDHDPAHEPTTAALVAVHEQHSALMRPVADYDEIIVAFAAYERLRNSIITASDLQRAGNKEFVTKSGWRKLGVVMGVSSELRLREYDRDEDGKFLRAEVVVRAIAPNGRFMDGLGVCDVYERCDNNCMMGPRDAKVPCTGFRHFSKPQHDIPATAYTRALNRACSDLFGFGEVSYEEVQGETAPPPEGFESHPAARARYDEIIEAGRTLDGYRPRADGGPLGESAAETFAQWLRTKGYKIPYSFAQCEEIDAQLSELGAQVPDPAVSARPESVPDTSTSRVESSGSAGGERGSDESVGSDASASPPNHSEGDSPPHEPSDAAPPAVPSRPPHSRRGTAGVPSVSTAGQRQRIAITECELVKASLLREGDKKEIVAMLTGDRTTTTTEMTADEANKMLATLAFLRKGDVEIDDDASGGRILLGKTARGSDFLGPLVAALAEQS